MSPRLSTLFDPAWFSNDESQLAFRLHGPACGRTQAVEADWRSLKDGFAGNPGALKNATSPFLVLRHLPFACPGCGTHLVVHLSGAAGGRQGEIQYGVAGLEHAGTTMLSGLQRP